MSKRIIFINGLALFAMFFGAGNIIYPLTLGSQAGHHLFFVMLAFLISGIGLPFLGLFATSLYQGDYWAFFNKLGKLPAFLIVGFLILTIGPFFGAPRCEAIAYRALEPFLPGVFHSPILFSALFCILSLFLTSKPSKVVDIIGCILSPIKISLFCLLIILGVSHPHSIEPAHRTLVSSIKFGVINGYSTMDLLAAFFFCAVICKNISSRLEGQNSAHKVIITRSFLMSCLIGGSILASVYIGFMWVAYCYAKELQGIATADMIVTISHLVLGKFGSLFVGVCVSFACMVTVMALVEVSTHFIFERILRKKVARLPCLVGVVFMIFCMSLFGFEGMMKVILPLVQVLYPLLIVYSLVSIVMYFNSFSSGK